MMDENDISKEVEKALGVEVLKSVVKGNGTRLGNVTLAVEMEAVIESLAHRIKQMETIKAAVEALRATL